jgi:hypothetical protein
MPQYATLVGAKELFAKELIIINSTLAHVTYKNSRCISLNTLMYLQYKYFKYILCSIGIQFEAYKFTFYMDNESVIFY